MGDKATVFVVDDAPGVLKSTKWLLDSEGFRVKTFGSADDFLSVYDPAEPGCLLLDVCMPGMSGLQLQEKLVERGVAPPIIFLTGRCDIPGSVRAIKLGAFAFVEKPIGHVELIGLVREAIEEDVERRRLEQEHGEIRSRFDSLTSRQREVMHMLVDGIPPKKIAAALGVCKQTAAKHRTQVLRKLKVGSEAELVRLLVDHSLDSP